MLFVGHTRFSLFLPNSSAWRASNQSKYESPEEYKNYLYSDDRLRQRSEVFIDESLPQIAAAKKEHDIVHVVSYSDSLPTRYKEKLRQAALDFPFLHLDERQPDQVGNDVVPAAKKAVEIYKPDHRVFGRYRLDDDDILPVTYFERMSKYLTPEHVGWMVSFGTGFTGLRVNDHYYDIRHSYYAMLAIGLLSVCQVDMSGKVKQPISTSHVLSDRANPVILDSREPGYFWSRHPQQDTTLTSSSATESELSNRLRDSISRFPAVTDIKILEKLFPEVHKKMHLAASPAHEAPNLLSQRTKISDAKLTFLHDSRLQTFGVAGTLEISGEPRKYNALISLELADTNGQNLTNEASDKLRSAGIYTSSSASIGFYRYIKTREGLHPFDYIFELPENIVCNAVSIQKFGKSESEMSLTHLALYNPEVIWKSR